MRLDIGFCSIILTQSRSILEPTEYIDNLFHLESQFGTPNLSAFERLNNMEMMWVITEIVSETNVRNRAKVIKEFIKVYQCISFHETLRV